MNLKSVYQNRYEDTLVRIAERLEEHLRDNLAGIPRIDRVTARAKAPNSFLKKAATIVDEQPKYADPLNQIQDQIGARVVTFFLDDVDTVSKEVEAYYRPIESRLHVPDSESEFGYVGKHYILLLPNDVVRNDIDESQAPKFFELQIKTLFQHAWSEAEHDLGYKPNGSLQPEEKRKLAFTAAQAWGADQIFRDLFRAQDV